ncbi:MAG: hypothetical protein QM796_07720 [Chthoniobacteraceae bacterium]
MNLKTHPRPAENPELGKLFFERIPWNQPRFLIFISAVVVLLDFMTGPYLAFPFFFVFPVLLMAWNSSTRLAITLAIVLSLIRTAFNHYWHLPMSWEVSVLNTIMRAGVLILIAKMAGRLSVQAKLLRERVTTLEGLLPICGFCKKIRDEKNEWQQVERYISDRTDADFSHGICPCCAEEHYGDAMEKIRSRRTGLATYPEAA